MKKIKAPSEAASQAMELGILLGRRQAFATVAGRCTAAQVEAMRRMRDSKLYLSVAANWGEYCSNVLKMTGRNANLLIGYLNEFGPEYFDLASAFMAERGGFEPPVELLTLRRFSKPLLSTTQPPLRLLSRSVQRILPYGAALQRRMRHPSPQRRCGLLVDEIANSEIPFRAPC